MLLNMNGFSSNSLVTNQRSRIDIMTMAKARYVGGFGQAGSVQLP